MDIDDVLEKMSTKVEKDKKYLKGLFNKEKVELEEAFGDSLPDKRIIELSLVKIGKRYGMDKASVTSLYEDTINDLLNEVEDENDDILDDLDDIIEEEEDDDEDDDELKGDIGRQSWKSFAATVVEPVEQFVEYERTPSLIVQIGATYTLKVDPTEPPYEHEFDGTYGLYTKWAFKVVLVKVSDEELYDIHYKKGDFEGQPAFVNGNRYTLWLDEKGKNSFGMFWLKLTGDGIPDDRAITFKHGKKGKYNDFKFGLPKR